MDGRLVDGTMPFQNPRAFQNRSGSENKSFDSLAPTEKSHRAPPQELGAEHWHPLSTGREFTKVNLTGTPSATYGNSASRTGSAIMGGTSLLFPRSKLVPR